MILNPNDFSTFDLTHQLENHPVIRSAFSIYTDDELTEFAFDDDDDDDWDDDDD